MTVEGELVTFIDIKRLPKGAKKTVYIEKNRHTFYETIDARLYMRNCVGDLFEIDLDYTRQELTYMDISNDYERVADLWGERMFCPKDNTRRRSVRVHSYRRRR